MNVVRIGRPATVNNFVNYSPFVYVTMPGVYSLADYWTTTFGTGEEDNTLKIIITQFSRNTTDRYIEETSIANCQALEQSWYWDFENQKLYVHFEHDQNPFTDTYVYNYAEGFCDGTSVIYIDDIEYPPLVTSVPSLSQQASIVGYDKQTYITGSIGFNNAAQFKNEDGPLDFLFTENVYRNAVELFYLDTEDLTTDGKIYSATETGLVSTGYFFIEYFGFTLSTITLHIQDQRKLEDISIPNEFFNLTDYPDINDDYIGDVIPVAYGLIREIPCVPIDGDASGAVTFRAAESLTSFGTIQVKIDDVWTTKTATSSTLATGTFTLSDSDSRDADDKIYDCKLVSPIGEAVTYASDVIKALNLKYLGIPYSSSFYDTDEWELEETRLTTIGILLNEQKLLSDWNYLIQSGANIGFRYEITPAGLRTIRVKDNDRSAAAFVPNSVITNLSDLPVGTNPSKTVYAQVKVSYSPSYVLNKFLSVTNTDYYDSVRYSYKSFRELSVSSYLTTSTDADSRAATEALDYSIVRPNASATVYGAEYLQLKLYDTIIIEMSSGDVDIDNNIISGRKYFGIQKALILGINPSAKNQTNNLTLRLIEEVDELKIKQLADDKFKALADNSIKAIGA